MLKTSCESFVGSNPTVTILLRFQLISLSLLMNKDRNDSLETIDLSSESEYNTKKMNFIKRLFMKCYLCK